MLDAAHDTIAAIATPPGVGGIGVVRISGPKAGAIAAAIVERTLTPRRATVTNFLDANGTTIDTGIGLLFLGPASFTGEDVLELQGHGGSVVLDMLLERALALGARTARAGEFTERAFLNQKLDLAQAEAVADLIEAASEQAARLAQRSLAGHFSKHVHALTESIIELRAFVEAGIDFPDEEIDLLENEDIGLRLDGIAQRLRDTLSAAAQGRLLREGIRCVLMGPPNVGKSSLLNGLVGHERAIVTDIPGTTRDTVDESVLIDGVRVTFTDTAGVHDAGDRVEQEGIARTHRAAAEADVVLLVDDANGPQSPYQSAPDARPSLRVWNKVDLLETVPENGGHDVYVSARTGVGLSALGEKIVATLGIEPGGEGLFMARRRHIEALSAANEGIENAKDIFEQRLGIELIAEELRQAARSLASITGEFTTEDLLAEIFSRFCIGK
ncbi:MAG: tRNA uridine-5-carboxymethylaminomethyl(34) synthesis GTPase MnmE [Pseudomonadota bacterium]